MAKPDILTMPSRRPATTRPECVRIRGARCLCRECGDYVTVAHIVRGERGAFCSHCCPACNPRTPLSGGPHAA